MNDIAIWTEKLVKAYSQVKAVDELSLNVPRGGIYGFLGRNGAGKSTLIGMLAGMLQPDAGTIRVAGEAVTIDSPRRALGLGIGTNTAGFSIL